MESLKMNLQFFADENTVDDSDEFDLEAIRQEVENEYSTDEGDGETTPPPEETTPPDENEDNNTGTGTESKGESGSGESNDNQKDAQAFAQMRNQLKQREQYEGFVQGLADQYGVKPEELMNRFQEQQLEKEAEQQGTSPEVLRRVRELESKNQELENQTVAEKFNNDVANTLKDHGVEENDPTVEGTFKYIADHYMDSNNRPTISFKDAYLLANRDALIAKQVEQKQQQDLEAKKQRQQSSAVASGSGQTATNDDWTMDSVEKYLKEHDFID